MREPHTVPHLDTLALREGERILVRARASVNEKFLRGLAHGGWATILTSRSAIEARVLVTERIRPLQVQGRTLQTVGLPFHWGFRGLTTGGAANDLFPIVLDPNVYIQEVKAATCDIRPGRLPARRDGSR